jgi:anti-anti-sigma factor
MTAKLPPAIDGAVMTIRKRNVAGRVFLDLKGHLTTDAAGALSREIEHELESRNTDIVLNLGEVTHIDSGGLSALLNVYSAVTNRGGNARLINVTQRHLALLAVTKLSTVFDVLD